MKNRLFSAVSAAALSFSLIAGSVSAQDLGLKQLQDTASAAMSQLGMDTTMVDALTLDELTEIQAITSGSETNMIKTDRIGSVMRNAEERIAAGGSVVPSGPAGDVQAEDMTSTAVLEASVGQTLAQLGFTDVDAESLSDQQLMEIQNVSSGTETEEVKTQEIERIIAN